MMGMIPINILTVIQILSCTCTLSLENYCMYMYTVRVYPLILKTKINSPYIMFTFIILYTHV